jgi:hypothetical protein
MRSTQLPPVYRLPQRVPFRVDIAAMKYQPGRQVNEDLRRALRTSSSSITASGLSCMTVGFEPVPDEPV